VFKRSTAKILIIVLFLKNNVDHGFKNKLFLKFRFAFVIIPNIDMKYG
jgi:hypothetical protein